MICSASLLSSETSIAVQPIYANAIPRSNNFEGFWPRRIAMIPAFFKRFFVETNGLNFSPKLSEYGSLFGPIYVIVQMHRVHLD